MKTELLSQLGKITEEEREILAGGGDVDWSYYSRINRHLVALDRMLRPGQFLAARPHTRFVDFPEHQHDYTEMMYVCQGQITHVVAGKEIVMHAGDLLFLSPQSPHAIRRAGEGDIGVNFIVRSAFFDIPLRMLPHDSMLAQFLTDTIRKRAPRPQYLHFRLKGVPEVENLIENLIYSALQGQAGEDNINAITMGLVFLHAMKHIDRLDKHSPHSYTDTLLMTTLRYIDTRYYDASLSELAATLHQSLSVLSRTIKHEMGCTFQDLVQRKRFQKAVTLLSETKLPIADIMNACGYANSSYFYRKFKEKYDMTPRTYRERHHSGEIIVL